MAAVLTSMDYLRLIAWLADKNDRITLSCRQIQTILFVCYGLYYAVTGNLLFRDDTPKAWVFGPAFPRSYRKYIFSKDYSLTEDMKVKFAKDVETLRMITNVTHKLCNFTDDELIAWACQGGTPWARVIMERKDIIWNTEISLEDIRVYFSSNDWKRGLQ